VLAAYSENREHNLEMKYLRKRLSEVDKRIVLPDSLQGSALLARLDGVEQKAPPMRVALISPRRLLNARSGFAYAAAFLLMVGLFYGLGIDKQNNLVDGMIALDREQGRSSAMQQDGQEMLQPSPSAPEDSARSYALKSEESDQPEAAPPKGAEMAPFAAIPDSSSSIALHREMEQESASDAAIGGVLSTQLCTFGEDYVLACRPVDQNDPDMGVSNVLEVLHHQENRLVALVPLPAMERVISAFTKDDLVAVVGEDQGFVYTLTVDLSHLEEPKPLELLEQPGVWKGARAFEDVVHVVSFAPQLLEGERNAVELPHSRETGTVIFTALSLKDGSYNQAAFLGAGEEMNLYNHSAYIYFNGYTVEENNEETEDLFVAKIKLADLDIELGGVS
jgi:hypothetical protein